MEVSATVVSRAGAHEARIATDGAARSLEIPPKEGAIGSSANGGELLALALATCYGNDVIREAGRAGIPVDAVRVTAHARFGAAGEPGTGLRYEVEVVSRADPAEVEALLRHTDEVAEIHTTLRVGTPVRLEAVRVVDA
ncbi:MAG: OsmC family protein [Actinomycetales bacterium]|nr:OsmC family protein [Actinomycetales bacterium]